MNNHPDQMDMFQQPMFPVRNPVARIDLSRFRSNLKRAMARAIRECPYERSEIVARMAHYLGLPSLSKASLDAYPRLPDRAARSLFGQIRRMAFVGQ